MQDEKLIHGFSTLYSVEEVIPIMDSVSLMNIGVNLNGMCVKPVIVTLKMPMSDVV